MHPGKTVLAVLAAAAMLAACDGVVDSPAPGEARFLMAEDPGTGEGGGGGGGGYVTDPFSPPPPPYLFQAPGLPVYAYGPGQAQCGQVTHAFWGFGHDITRGTPIYVTGVVAPYSRMNWGLYNQFGQQVKTRVTATAGSNCVVAHEPEVISTYDLNPGYYYLYASYNGLSPNGGSIESYYGYIIPIIGKYIGAIRVR